MPDSHALTFVVYDVVDRNGTELFTRSSTHFDIIAAWRAAHWLQATLDRAGQTDHYAVIQQHETKRTDIYVTR